MRRSFVSVICGFVVFSALADDSVLSPVTTKDYVDNALSDKQPLSPITGTNKIMTYGATTGAQTGSRDIETTSIGTDTTADKIAAAGIIVAALNNKQNTVIGTDDWVMTGSPYDGGYGGKPIYSATNNYVNALVTAETVNNAAIAAANSEFSCDLYVEGAEQIPDNCLIWRIHTDGPTLLPTPRTSIGDPTIPGSSYCARNLSSGNNDGNGSCTANMLTYIGERKNKSGKWGTIFPYGDVMGISVCGSIYGNSPFVVASDEQASTLDSEYATYSGTDASGGDNCWCKMTVPMASKWVYRGNLVNSSNGCTHHCTYNCANYLRVNPDFRSNMFGSVE